MDGKQCLQAKDLEKFFSSHSADESAMKAKGRKPKDFIQSFPTLFEWQDGPCHVWARRVLAVCGIRKHKLKVPLPRSFLCINKLQILMEEAGFGDLCNLGCSTTLEYSVNGPSTVVMCKAAWPMLLSYSSDLKVSCQSNSNSFTIRASGVSDSVESFILCTEKRIRSIEYQVISVPVEKQKRACCSDLVRNPMNYCSKALRL